MIYIPSY